MKINIICSEFDKGWVYEKFVGEFKKYSTKEILINSKLSCEITHALPYFEPFPNNAKIKTAWFSHQEFQNPLHDKFVNVAKSIDFSFSHSKKYMCMLINNHGVKNIKQVMPGVDIELFKQRSTTRNNKPGKLVVGFVGRQYTSSNRKNPVLLQKIQNLSFVELRATNGKIHSNDMPKFYNDIDVVASTSLCEGGTLGLQEGLACGTPTVCFEDVGVSNEFGEGIIRVPFGREDIFITRLKDMWQNKDHLSKWRDKNTMDNMRKQVEQFTWANFVRAHDKIWEELINGQD